MALRTPLSVTPHLYMGDSTGRPLDKGVVYFGEQDKDPEFYPINLFSDDALTKPLMQPVHTKGGYLYDKGDMVEPHAKEIIYSVKVLDSYGRKVFYKGAMMRNSWNDDVIEQINAAIVASADIARQVATDITNEAINNTAIEGGVLADTFVTVTSNEAGTVARSLRDVNTDSINARYYGAKGDNISNDSVALQKYFRDADDNRRSSIFIPMRSHNYLLQSPVVVQEPIMIYGDAGASYNRGYGKNGAILIGANADYAFDLGNQRIRVRGEHDVDNHISDNPADNWAVKNIKFLRDSGVAAYQKTAIKHTANNNGPDRGFLMREVSTQGMKHSLHVTNQGNEVQLASLVIENCCLSNNDIAVYAEGLVHGFRFVGNQCEQNTTGAIWGTFTSTITIEDNMLEAQPDPIKIIIPDIGGKVVMSVKRNYFEANSGTAFIEVSSSSNGSMLEVGPNFASRAGGVTSPDNYLLLKGKLTEPRNPSIGFLVINKDHEPVTLYETAIIMLGSDIFSQVNYFKQFDAYNAGGLGGRVFTDDLKKLPKSSPENSGAILTSASPSSETELGAIRYHTLTTSSYYRNINKAVASGDVFVLNLLLEASDDVEGSVYFNIIHGSASGTITEGTFNVGSTFIGNSGSLFLASLVCTALIGADSIRVGMRSSLTAGSVRLYGVSIGNEGQKVAGVSKEIHPSIPAVSYTQREVQQAYTPPTIEAGQSKTINVPFAGVSVGDTVIASYSQYHEDIKVEAVVSSTANVAVKFTNTGQSSVKQGAGIIKVKSI